MAAPERRRMLRHEAVHGLQQLLAPRSESLAARAQAERLANRAEVPGSRFSSEELLLPVPGLLAYPVQTFAPWSRVWVGYAGLLGEVVANGVTVRVFRGYEKLGITADRTSEYVKYLCGDHKSKEITSLASAMKVVAAIAGKMNDRLPKGAPQRTAMVVIFGDASSAGYRVHHGQGLVVLDEESFEKGSAADTLAHEGAHGIFEFHATGGGKGAGDRVPDPLALRIADLFTRLATTKPVPVPTRLFDSKAPPATVDPAQSAKAAGHVMVTDTLWAGVGGHPWQDADEFFASAFGGFVMAPALLKSAIDFYAKVDPAIKPLGIELLKLLAAVGKPKELAALKAPAKLAEAEKEMEGIRAAPEFLSGNPWLLDPSTMPGPEEFDCPTP
jgi:hypothetical protein